VSPNYLTNHLLCTQNYRDCFQHCKNCCLVWIKDSVYVIYTPILGKNSQAKI